MISSTGGGSSRAPWGNNHPSVPFRLGAHHHRRGEFGRGGPSGCAVLLNGSWSGLGDGAARATVRPVRCVCIHWKHTGAIRWTGQLRHGATRPTAPSVVVCPHPYIAATFGPFRQGASDRSSDSISTGIPVSQVLLFQTQGPQNFVSSLQTFCLCEIDSTWMSLRELLSWITKDFIDKCTETECFSITLMHPSFLLACR